MSAMDKSSGVSKSITIKNDKGLLIKHLHNGPISFQFMKSVQSDLQCREMMSQGTFLTASYQHTKKPSCLDEMYLEMIAVV